MSHVRGIDLNLTFLAISSSILFIILLVFAIKKEKTETEIKYTKKITEVETNA